MNRPTMSYYNGAQSESLQNGVSRPSTSSLMSQPLSADAYHPNAPVQTSYYSQMPDPHSFSQVASQGRSQSLQSSIMRVSAGQISHSHHSGAFSAFSSG